MKNNKHKMDEATLITRMQQGDEKAFAVLFQKYYPALWYFASCLLADEEFAHDVVEDCFIKFLNKINGFVLTGSLKSYLYTVTKNKFFDVLRDKKRQAAFEKEYAYLIDKYNDEEIERLQIESEVLSKVYEEVNLLSPQCRAVFILTHFDELNTNEISDQLGISVSAVTSHRSRAIKILRKKLKWLFVFVLLADLI
jgi:RNA polymerase sigma-70 factor (family 1)